MFKSFTTSQTKPTSYREEIVARKRLYRPYVTDGLKVYYDFANRASQQSGIARAFNLAGDDATAIHANGPVYTPNGNMTYMSYDAVDDLSRLYYDNAPDTTATTIEMITAIKGSGGMMVGTYSYGIWILNGNMGINTGRGDARGLYSSELTNLGVSMSDGSNFNHYAFVFTDDPYDAKMYINGVDRTTQTFVAGSAHNSPAATDISTKSDWRIADWANGGQNSNINVAEFKLYDRELSAREVAYNYGVAKSRKGV